MSDVNPIPPEKWVVPIFVYDEVTASDTANVFKNMGYFVDPVYRDANWPPDAQQ